MAKYRHVQTTFWDDGFVLDLTPEEKYFYLYLMTNGNTTQCGIYELPYRVIEMHTGYNRETVQKLLQRFSDYGKITYNESTKEIMLNNWAKYNFINSPKVKKCIEKELLTVKHIPFVNSYVTSLEQLGYSIDTVSIPLNSESESKVPTASNDKGSIPYQYPIDTLSKDYGEKEKQKEKQKEKNNNDDDGLPGVQTEIKPTLQQQNAFAFYEQNHFGALGSLIMYKIDGWINELSEPLVIKAMEKAVLNGKTNWGYVETILKDWRNKKLLTLEAVEAEDLRWKNQQIKATQQQNRPQRAYQRQGREEVVPEWFKNRNNDSASKKDEPTNPTEAIDFEAERQKILATLDRGHKKFEQTQKNS